MWQPCLEISQAHFIMQLACIMKSAWGDFLAGFPLFNLHQILSGISSYVVIDLLYLCTAPYSITHVYLSLYRSIDQTVGTQFYPSFNLRRPEETSILPRLITLGEWQPLKRINIPSIILRPDKYNTLTRDLFIIKT